VFEQKTARTAASACTTKTPAVLFASAHQASPEPIAQLSSTPAHHFPASITLIAQASTANSSVAAVRASLDPDARYKLIRALCYIPANMATASLQPREITSVPAIQVKNFVKITIKNFLMKKMNIFLFFEINFILKL
jgi:hypothetical protein